MWGLGEKTDNPPTEDGKPSPWSGSVGNAIDEARTKLTGVVSKRKKNSEGNKSGDTGGGLSEADQARIKQMFSPDNWRILVKLPFVTARVITGRDLWELDKTEEDTLAVGAAANAEYFFPTEAKYVALGMFFMNLSVIMCGKLIKNAQAKRQEEQTLGPDNLKQAA